MRLKRDLSKFSLFFISIGSIVGSGWLFGSFYTAQIAGPAAVLSWILGGIFVSIIAFTLAELVTLFPLSGGTTIFVTLTHGKFAGSLFSWITWLCTLIVAPLEVQAVLQYASSYIPNILNPATHTLSHMGFLYATILMLILTIINLVGVKIMADANNFIVLWKLIVPVVIVFVLLFYKPNPSNFSSAGGFMPHGISSVFTAIANGGIALSYYGFQNAIYLAGEAKTPQKSLPFALFGSIIVAIFLYVLLQIGFILSVDPSALTHGWTALSFKSDAGPLAGIFLAFGLPFMIWILYTDAIISPFGSSIGYSAISSRVLYAMGLQGDAPSIVSKTNRFSIPWVAVILNSLFGLLFFLPISGWQEMASFISAAVILTLAVGPLCLPIFRDKYPKLKRSFILKHHKITTFITFYICNLILHWTGWNTVWKLESIVITGCVVQFFLHLYRHKNLDFDFKTLSWVWIPIYLGLAGLISYLGSYNGGRGVIPAGPDFIVILASSGFVYWFSQKFTLPTQKSRMLYKQILENHTVARTIVHEE